MEAYIDIFYYEDFNNIDDETITKINEKIQPNLNRGEKLNMNLDFKYYLIFKYIEFVDFFNSNMNSSKNLLRYNFLPLSISDSIPEIIKRSFVPSLLGVIIFILSLYFDLTKKAVN